VSAPTSVFVTGTDTGIGKTVVSAAVAHAWAASGASVTYVKPAQSGTDDGDDDARDVLVWTRGVRVVTGPALGASLAPAVAARLAGVELTGEELVGVVAAVRDERPDDRLVVEGAGGVLVELGTDGTTCLDLAVALSLPVLVVARPGLGTLNHTALTLAELDRREVPVAGVVVSGYPADPDLATSTNLDELQRLSGGRLAGVVPVLDLTAPRALDPAATWFTPALGGEADVASLIARRS